jgi:phi LC3 family holin
MNNFFANLKMNIPIRFRNWAFWLGLIAAILAAMNVSPEMFTSWNILWQEIVALVSNPFRLGCVVVAVMGIFTDPTTPGIGDSTRALSYVKPGQIKE